MIYAFDLDGTLCEGWYGDTHPNFYWNDLDRITRANHEDVYKDVLPISDALGYILKTYLNNRENVKFVVLSSISSGQEFLQKIAFLDREFINPYDDGKPVFKHNDIYGVLSDEEKIEILKDFASKDIVVYFDDNMGTVMKANQEIRGSKYPFAALHSSSLLFRKPEDVEKL